MVSGVLRINSLKKLQESKEVILISIHYVKKLKK